jgi:hypothetical protein
MLRLSRPCQHVTQTTLYCPNDDCEDNADYNGDRCVVSVVFRYREKNYKHRERDDVGGPA